MRSILASGPRSEAQQNTGSILWPVTRQKNILGPEYQRATTYTSNPKSKALNSTAETLNRLLRLSALHIFSLCTVRQCAALGTPEELFIMHTHTCARKQHLGRNLCHAGLSCPGPHSRCATGLGLGFGMWWLVLGSPQC